MVACQYFEVSAEFKITPDPLLCQLFNAEIFTRASDNGLYPMRSLYSAEGWVAGRHSSLAAPVNSKEPTHDSPFCLQFPKLMITPANAQDPLLSPQQDQCFTSFHQAFHMNACDADVVSSDELIEAIYENLHDLSDIRTTLEKGKCLPDSGWQAMCNFKADSHLSLDSSLEEKEAFGGLAAIFDQCTHAAGISAADCMVQLKVHRHVANFPNNTRPDATIHLTNSCLPWLRGDTGIDHADVHMYLQFKRKDNKKNFDDDVNNLLWNVHHRFHSDPCCRFVCGLTIEVTTARFWHFSRAAVMVSEPFDIMTDPDKLIHIFVASARAKTSADLGFDPTITCITGHSIDDRKYQITIHNNKDGSKNSTDSGQSHERTFTTQRTIANYRAVGIQSRGTWVFEGFEGQPPNATPVVIKDVWIDSDREVEGIILDNVREALKDSPDELQLFLEPLCHGCVFIDGTKDLTQPLLKSKEVMSLAYSENIVSSSNTSVFHKRPEGELSPGSVWNVPAEESIIIGRCGDRRKHYRIVFKGKPGQALRDLKSYQEVFKALLGGVKALRALHRVGYIHRDLSAGNILLVKEAEEKDRGVLIDFEYGKRFPDTSKKGHDARTGTLQFMAAEVNLREFIFLPPPEWDPPSSLSGSVVPAPSTPTSVPWFHNPIHDIESAWWIAFWSFHHINGWVGTDSVTNAAIRQSILTAPNLFLARCRTLPGTVLRLLYDWLRFIREQYIKLEKLVSDQSHISFDYDYVFRISIRFVAAIIDALQKLQDPALSSEELADSAGPPSNKRQKVEHGQGGI